MATIGVPGRGAGAAVEIDKLIGKNRTARRTVILNLDRPPPKPEPPDALAFVGRIVRVVAELPGIGVQLS